jgi:pyruvate formate lyase activating enzyme
VPTPEALVAKVVRYREYLGEDGGITLSGGEPLLQADFAREVFARCREQGIHTCLDTSGCVLNDSIRALLDVTDRVLLDIKYTSDADYRRFVGCSLNAPLAFLAELEERGLPTTLRQVILPTLNDSETSVLALREIARAHKCVDGVELLPFRKMCQVKYDRMGLKFPFGHLDEPSRERMAELARLVRER